MSFSHRLRKPLCYGAKKKNLWVIPENHKIPPHNNASYIDMYDYRSTHCLFVDLGDPICLRNIRTNFSKLGFKIVGKDRLKLVKKEKKCCKTGHC